MRWMLLIVLVTGCRKAHVDVKPDDKKSGPPRVTCTLPDPIANTTIPARCDLTIGKLVTVPPGVTITIEKGAKLLFGKDAGLRFEGGMLRATGTAEEPIVLTSASHAKGSWKGVVFERRALMAMPEVAAKTDAAAPPPYGDSHLEHVTIEYGAGLTVNSGSDTVALTNVRLHDNDEDLNAPQPKGVTQLENVVIGENGSATVPFDLVDKFTAFKNIKLHLTGSINASLTLPKLEQPYVVDSLEIRPKTAPIAVTIADGTTVKFATRGLAPVWMDGAAHEAKLVAHDVTFTSNEPTAKMGIWGGFVLFGDVAVDFDKVTVEYAGSRVGPSGGVFRVPAIDKKTRVVNSTFRNNNLPAFESEDCKKWEDPALKNTSVGKPMCDESPYAKMFKSIGSVGALGALGGTSSIGSVFGSPSSMTTWGDDVLGAPGSGFGSGGLGLGKVGSGGTIGKGPTVTESSITASGALPVEVVRKRVRASTSSLRACHSGASGTITVSFTIDDKGSVTSATATGGSIADATERGCVAGVFSGMSFPAPDPPGTTNATATHSYD